MSLNAVLLNNEQKKAVDTTEGPLLIIAGAGAGKTKTVTERVIALMDKGVSGRNILGITFTNKAAREMRERVLGRIDNSHHIPLLTTFHSLGVKILREHAQLFNLPRHFSIYDKTDSKRAVKQAMEKVGVDPKKYEPSTILNRISKEKGEGKTLAKYKEIARAGDHAEGLTLRIWESYEEILKKEKALDFDDLLLRTLMLLENHKDVLKNYQEQWKYIHVDEYQDTNRVQYLIVTHLAAGHRNLCVVGDIDQNIYSWRGADIRNILNFEKDYPDATVVLLEENYRSTQIILSAANDIIKKNKHRREKNLFTRKQEGDKIKVFKAIDENHEAEFIASSCAKLIKEGMPPQEIGVLFRANYQSRVIEDAFLRHDISYDIVGTRYFERKEVKDVLSYIRAALTGGEGDVRRIMNVPARGIGAQTEEKILLSGIAELFDGEMYKADTEEELRDHMERIKQAIQEKLDGTVRQKAEVFFTIIFKIKHAMLSKKISELVKYVIEISGIQAMYEDGKDEDEDKLGNIRELVTIATKYDTLPKEEGMLGLLEEAALATDQETDDRREGVKLMTIHSSKGLEFDAVFIAGLEADLFPHKRSFESRITPEEAEEERRLFYVALTRARKQLYLTHATLRTIYGERRVNVPSEFIFDIDEDKVEYVENHDKYAGIKSIFIDF